MKPDRRQKTQFGFFLGILAVLALIISFSVIISGINSFNKASNQGHRLQDQSTKSVSSSSASSKSTSNQNDDSNLQPVPTDQAANAYNSVKNQLPKNAHYNNAGAFILNNNHAQLKIGKTNHPYAANTIDPENRPGVANAFLTHQTRQYQNRQQTNNGATSWKPAGYHQLSNIPGKYRYAYNRGHLLAYALVGNLHGYDASEHNHKNIVTQTMWSNQANEANNTGQNYYEGLVRKALDQNKQVRYQVMPIYASNKDQVPTGMHIQALSTDGSLNFNVFVPNVQNNIKINYQTGFARRLN